MGTSSVFALSPRDQGELWKLEFSIVELKKQVTTVDSLKDHDTSLALARVVMLSTNVINLATESSKENCDLLIMQQVQPLETSSISEWMKEQSSELKKSKKKINSLEKQAKLDFDVIEQAKLALTVAIQEQDASYATITEIQGKVTIVLEQLNKALRELEKIVCSRFLNGCTIRGLIELATVMTNN
ncbi:hypothetical protein Acr_08g0010780 [Actinidia rufa]|uniref:Uncharacterized protein n=1 Tax=Actinidia rufa TaxID=165716 RepID=A0A7J0F1W9_9ERIC|nr:hypothetical protein Acr_08g0010780 [Actinidia rufa]